MAANASTMADEDGDYEDWIELLNVGEDEVNLSGWWLSDSYTHPFKWSFGDVTLVPGEFLLVWASGKDRTVATNGYSLHTSFSIATAGEELLLTRPDGSRADELTPRPIPTDISLGRQPDGSGDWFYFTDPTPGMANQSVGFHAIVEPPLFSHAAGIHTQEFELVLFHPDPTVTILYSLDGSEPALGRLAGEWYEYKNEYRGTNVTPSLFREMRSHLYSGPLAITNRSEAPFELATINTHTSTATIEPASNIFKGTVVRARAFQDGAVPSSVVTSTYFVSPGMDQRYTLPVIALTGEEQDLFSFETGIYVHGGGRPPQPWGQPANFWGRGPEWERPAHMEVFYPDGRTGFSENLGIRIHGGGSREHRLKSLRLYARSRYGTPAFQHAFFPGLERRGPGNEPLESFQRLLLRAAGQDWDKAYYRDPFMQELVGHLPLDRQAYQPAVHFINGEYWGLINIRERLDAHYLATHYDLDREDVVILTGWNGQIDTGNEDDLQDFLDVVAYAESHDLGHPEHHTWIRNRVDTTNLALYYAARIYFNDWDWPQNNLDWWRKRVASPEADAPPGHDGRWRWLLYDTDFGYHGYMGPHANGLDRVVHLTPGHSHMGAPVISNMVNRLFRSLVHEQAAFRHEFINVMADQLNTAWLPARAAALLEEFEDRIGPYREEHNNRWSINTGPQQQMLDFATTRPDFLRSQILSVFDLPGLFELIVNISNPDGGIVQINNTPLNGNTLGIPDPSLPYPWTGHYFRTVPIQLTAVAAPGHRFTGWSGISSEHKSVILLPASNLMVTAHFEPNAPPVALPTDPHHQWIEGSGPRFFLLNDFFTDPDGDELDIHVTSTHPNKVHVELEADHVRLTPLERGQSRILLTASDGHHDPATSSFHVLVYPEAKAVANASWALDAWEEHHAEGTYPENMLFLQSEQNDTGLTTSLPYAYHLQPEDYHADDSNTVGFPYNNTRRTRINGLGADGLAFINTGQGRDLGGALLALDTRDTDHLWVKWTGGTVLPNDRIYALRLQYRIGIEGEFEDALDDTGQPVEYIRNPAAGHEHVFAPLSLPASILGQEYVQLLWRYHRISGTSGPRAQLRLDDILVTPFGVESRVFPPSTGMVTGQHVFVAADAAYFTALPAAHHQFARWEGDVPEGAAEENPLFLAVTGSHMVTAHFAAHVTTNTGTPHWWFAQYGLTNSSFEEAATQDHSGNQLPAWVEYIADLDPTDPAARLPALFWEMNDGTIELGLDTTSVQRLYTIKRTTNLLDAASWIILTNVPGTGSDWRYSPEELSPPSPPLYFRSRIIVPDN